ncbi:MAG: hydroxymethylglutaryl-CoA lyase [Leptospiraceae bacterium]|nr:hydroxymethylglutaryl-CoA lyase [Leptospiraceae bacterium]
MNASAAKSVTLYEVGPRDGLQNEKQAVPPEVKIEYINRLARTGLRFIEATSFVKPGAIPQLQDAAEVMSGIERPDSVNFVALVPNQRGMQAAIDAGLRTIAVFTAASDAFTQKNINCTVAESLARFADVFALAREHSIRVRAYVSTVVECPYAGRIDPGAVLQVSQKLLDMGAYEISLGETIGVAVPDDIARLLDALLSDIPADKLAGHYHDTRGTALANVMRSLEYGLRTFDASSAGLGGCPYAPGAAGNVATEDLVYALERSGYETGVNLVALAEASRYILENMQRASVSRVYATIPQQN